MSIAHQYGLVKDDRLDPPRFADGPSGCGNLKSARVTKNTVTKKASVTKKRGRPKLASVKNQAERARAYRARKKGKA